MQNSQITCILPQSPDTNLTGDGVTNDDPQYDADWWPKAVRSSDVAGLRRAVLEKPSGLRWQDKFGRTLLHLAASIGNVDTIQLLVSLQFDLNAKDEHGQTPLHEAIRLGRKDAIDCLIRHGADVLATNNCNLFALMYAVEVNQVVSLEALFAHRDRVSAAAADCNGSTALHLAAAKNYTDCITILLHNGAAPCQRNNAELCAVHVAAYAGSAESLELLLLYSRQLNYPVSRFINMSDAEGNLALHSAVDSGSLDTVKVCIQHGAFIDAQQKDKSTPVHFAALRGELAMLRTMFEAQPDRKSNALRLADKNGMTALHKAVLFDNESVAELLLDEQADIEAEDVNEQTALLLAASKGSSKCVRLLVKRGANMNRIDKDGRNFVHLAVLNSADLKTVTNDSANKVTVEELLNQKDNFGCTPLHYASLEGHLGAADSLINFGARLRVSTNTKTTAIHLAAKYGRYKTCKILLDSPEGSCAINMADGRGLTALHLAAKNGHTKVVQLLLERGAILHNAYCGNSPFNLATLGGHIKTMRLLLTVHPNLINMACYQGSTALHLAALYGHAAATEFLLTEGAEVKVNKDGFTFFDVAMKHRQKDVCAAAMNHDRWREILSIRSPSYPSPIFGLIEELPEVCFFVLERCVSDNGKACSSPELAYTYDFTFLELTRPDFSKSDRKAVPMDWSVLDRHKPATNVNHAFESEPIVKGEQQQKPQDSHAKSQAETNELRFPEIYQNSLPVINHMVKFSRVDLLVSPLCKQYMNMKWNRYARTHVLSCSFSHLFSVIVLAVITWRSSSLVQCSLLIDEECDNWLNTTCVDEYVKSDRCAMPSIVIVCNALLLLCAVALSFFSLKCIDSKRLYCMLDMENLLTFVAIAAFFTYSIPNFINFHSAVPKAYQWNFLAIAAVAECFAFVLNLRGLGPLGLYVVMFVEILKTLAKSTLVFGILINGFALAFSILFQIPVDSASDYETYMAALSFKNPIFSFMRVIAMATGELDVRDTVIAGAIDPALKKGLPFPLTSTVLYLLFTIFITVALLNLIVGLAIGDIKVVRHSATLKRLSIQAETYKTLENFLYKTRLANRCCRDLRPQSVTVHPNVARSCLKKLIHRIESSVDANTRPKSIDQAVEASNRIKFQENVTNNLDKGKQRWKKICASLDRQEELISYILGKMEIKTQASGVHKDGCADCALHKEFQSTKSRAVADWDKLFMALMSKKEPANTEVDMMENNESVAFIDRKKNRRGSKKDFPVPSEKNHAT